MRLAAMTGCELGADAQRAGDVPRHLDLQADELAGRVCGTPRAVVGANPNAKNAFPHDLGEGALAGRAPWAAAGRLEGRARPRQTGRRGRGGVRRR